MIYVASIALGIAAGMKFKIINTKTLSRIVLILVIALITCMGFKIGSSEIILANLSRLGLNALILGVVPLILTVAGVHVFRKLAGYDNHAEKIDKESGSVQDPLKEIAAPSGSMSGNSNAEAEDPQKWDNADSASSTLSAVTDFLKGNSLKYLTGLIVGLLAGYFLVVKSGTFDFDTANGVIGTFITYALYCMVFFAGMDIGSQGIDFESLKEIGKFTIELCLVTGLIYEASNFGIALLLGYSAHEALLLANCFCFYTMSSSIIMGAGFTSLGAVAFISCFGRVILSLLLIPTVAKRLGYLETVGMSMAASMDVCIGTIEHSTNKFTVLVAFPHGLLFTIWVPFVMPILASL